MVQQDRNHELHETPAYLLITLNVILSWQTARKAKYILLFTTLKYLIKQRDSRNYTCNSSALFFFMWVVSMPAWVSNTVFHFPVTSSTDALETEDSVLILFILPTDVEKGFLVFLSSRLNVCKGKSERNLIICKL